MARSLVSINELKPDSIRRLMHQARVMKEHPRDFRKAMEGQVLGLIFEKPSTRTRVSFETAMVTMGGSAAYINQQDEKLGQREEVRDVARTLSRYFSAAVLRTFSHWTITEFRRHFKKPVINGLSDMEHPCQALADFMTIEEKFGDVKNATLAFVGDGNNVLNSLMLTAAKLGTHLKFSTPRNNRPYKKVIDLARQICKKTKGKIEECRDPKSAVKNAQVVYTDVWVSMGEEEIREMKMREFEGFQVNRNLIKHASKEALVMHCLPAHRGEEITDDIMESKRSIVFDQAENRLHIQKAIILYLLEQGEAS
ncbi:MAG TPA: ornithine carbamoyltransferase [Candidatus Omnitrophota bacterium]|nr:ornithine carbamoyltransferase [Candidatus Omnitrophota bacterium]